MAAAPDDDARRTLAELEAKLRELERELLRGHEPEAAPPPAPAPAPAPAAPLGEPPAAFEPAPEPELPPAQAFGAEPPAPEPLGAEPPAAEPPAQDPLAPPLGAEPPARDPLAPPLDGGGGWIVPGVPSAVEPEAPFEPEPQPEPEPEPEPEPLLDLDALQDAHSLLADLRATIEGLGVTAERITTEAHAVIDDHGRTLGRLERAADAAARAEQAAIEAGRLAATVVVEAGPFADATAVAALRDALAAQPGARDAYVRGVEDGRAVIEVHLAPPPA
jgi:hypothetical protein